MQITFRKDSDIVAMSDISEVPCLVYFRRIDKYDIYTNQPEHDERLPDIVFALPYAAITASTV